MSRLLSPNLSNTRPHITDIVSSTRRWTKIARVAAILIVICGQDSTAFQITRTSVGLKRQRQQLLEQSIFRASKCKRRAASPVILQSSGISTLASSATPAFSFAWVYMALLALQFGCQPLLTRAYTPKTIIRSTVVAAQEFVKLVSCLAALIVTHSWDSTVEGWTLASWWLGAGLPAALYVVQNYCALIAYQHLPAVTFNVLNQTKTLSAALFCFFLLGRQQSCWQVGALFLLLAAGLIIERVVPLPDISLGKQKKNSLQTDGQLSSSSFSTASDRDVSVAKLTSTSNAPKTFKSDDSDSETKQARYTHLTKGVIPVLMASLISGLAGALSQRALQIWDRNSYLFSLELSSASLLMLLASILVGSPDGQRIFQRQVDGDTSSSWIDRIGEGWTWKTWIPITTNALGGVLVGLVTKYSGSVRKGFALIFGLLLSGILQNNLSHKNGDDGSSGGVSKEQLVGGCLAAISLWIYSNFPHVPTPHP